MRKNLQILAIMLMVVVIISVIGTLYYFTPKTLTIKIGFQPSTHQVAEFILIKLYYDKIVDEAKKLGYNIKIEDSCYESGPPEMQEFLAGKLDMAYVGATPPIPEIWNAIETGGPKALIVAGCNLGGSALILRTGIEYTGPSSLKGLKIGTFPPGSIQHTILTKWLSKNSLSYSTEEGTDVILKYAGAAELISLLKANKIDAAFLPSPSPEICEMEGIGKIAVTSTDMWRNATGMEYQPCCVLTMSNKFIEKYRNLAKIFLKYHIIAMRDLIIDVNVSSKAGTLTTLLRRVVAERLSELWGKDEESIINILEYTFINNPTNLIFSYDPHLIINGVLKYIEAHYEIGNIGRMLNVDEVFYLDLYDEVIGELE